MREDVLRRHGDVREGFDVDYGFRENRVEEFNGFER